MRRQRRRKISRICKFQDYAAEGGEKIPGLNSRITPPKGRKRDLTPEFRDLTSEFQDLTPEFRDYAAKRRKIPGLKFQSYAAEGGEKSSRIKQNL